MSPRRRLFLITLLAMVLALSAIAAVQALGSREGPRRAVPQDRPGPVLLVPGYGGGVGALSALADRLRRTGRTATIVALPDGAVGDLREQARTVRDAAEVALRAPGAASVDVVGFSAGGVVARLWIRDYGGRAAVRRVVTLGSPHHGTELAALAGGLVPNACPLACQQLATGSPLLQVLNAGDETPDGPRWVSIWTAVDVVVSPPESAVLDGAIDVRLQSVCPDDAVAHGDLPTDPLVAGLVIRAFGAAEPAAPNATDCAALRSLGSG